MSPADEVRAAAESLREHQTAREHVLLADLLDHIADDMVRDGADESDSYGDSLVVVDRFDQPRHDWDDALRLARHIGGGS